MNSNTYTKCMINERKTQKKIKKHQLLKLTSQLSKVIQNQEDRNEANVREYEKENHNCCLNETVTFTTLQLKKKTEMQQYLTNQLVKKKKKTILEVAKK